MGFPMALNLRRKISKEKAMIICDMNEAALSKFQVETSEYGPVSVVQSPAEAIDAAVSISW